MSDVSGFAVLKKVPSNFQSLMEVLIVGVAFRTTNATWDVFSHGGEFIGQVPTYAIESLVAYLRRNVGVEPQHVPNHPWSRRDSITYGFDIEVSEDSAAVLAEIEERYFINPLIIR